jgi:hypothetical protein
MDTNVFTTSRPATLSFRQQLFSTVSTWNRGEKINCIKRVREMTHCSLVSAKNYVEAIFADPSFSPPIPFDIDLNNQPTVQPPAPPRIKDYAEAKKPISDARQAYVLAITTMLTDPNVDQWTKDDILRSIRDDFDTIQNYLRLVNPD